MPLKRAGIFRFAVLAFFAAVLILSGPVSAWCTTLTFSGAFSFDNDVHIITFSTTHTGLTSIFTTSFANGGFLPVISLFDSAGNIIASDGGLFNSDAAFNYSGVAGASYSLAVTQWGNTPVGTLLSDGFFFTDVLYVNNYTATPPYNQDDVPGGMFLTPAPNEELRTGNWDVTVQWADATVPEPTSLLLLLTGVASLAICMRQKWGHRQT